MRTENGHVDLNALIQRREEVDALIERALADRTRASIAALRERRVALGLTQDQVAQACGLSRAQITNAEGGHGNLSLPAFFGYAQAVGLQVDLVLRPGTTPGGAA